MYEVRVITEILSEENISLHKEYVRQMRLRYSILESDLPRLRGASVFELSRLRLDKRDLKDALELLPEIVLHDIFFDSFTDKKYTRSEAVTLRYGSEANLLNELYRLSKGARYGFLVVGRDTRASLISDYVDAFKLGDPILAVDLIEHSYFLDYGFDRDRYVLKCLSHLNLKKL